MVYERGGLGIAVSGILSLILDVVDEQFMFVFVRFVVIEILKCESNN